MAKTQVSKSEQITSNLSLVLDYDEPLSKKDNFIEAFNYALDGKCELLKYKDTKNVYIYKSEKKIHYFLTGAITYLSKPHPLFKKRLQLKLWFKDFYNEYSRRPIADIHLVGIYHYQGLYLFVDFKTEDYIGRKLNSSAAHIYTNDLYQGLCNGQFSKTDWNGNHITVTTTRSFKQFLLGKINENPIFSLFNKFNNSFEFGNWIKADYAITEMKNAQWYQWRGTEWPGWYLEYKFSCFVFAQNCKNEMVYIGNEKDKTLLDFDIFFPKANYYGDLKASDIDKKETPGNDQENVLKAINQYGKLWYVIYEHKTEKDSAHNNEMAIKRMQLLGTEFHEGDKISYAAKMKHSVEFRQMKIFELNRINMNETLSVFNQGHQPDGKDRAPKFLINKNNIDNFIVYSYEYKQNLEYKNSNISKHLKVADSNK